VVAVWLLYCVVIGACYSGELKAYMTTPTYTSQIKTLSEVIDSGLTWQMVMYGEEEEARMAVSTDPIIKKIWDDKIVVEYSSTPMVSVHSRFQ
jgi:hypothetical protein